MSQLLRLDRRRLLTRAAAGMGGILLARSAPAQIRRDAARPESPSGVQSGDVTSESAVVWGRADRPARMWVEWSTSENFSHAHRVAGPNALPDTDHTGRVVLEDLPA